MQPATELAAAVEVAAVVLAGGASVRLAAAIPKPFRQLGGRPMLDYSLSAFAGATSVTSIVVVLPASLLGAMTDSLLSAPKVRAVTAGGPSRQESLLRGLAVIPDDASVVAVHDAARPLITPGIIDRVVAGVSEGFSGAVCAIPLDDAIKRVGEGDEILGPRSRVGLWRAQTPQVFRRDCLETALAQAIAAGVVCDDCSEMATRAGYRVRVVQGDPRNVKVTRPGDLELCERLLGGDGAGDVGRGA
ncbi:MAG: 2-C-methyl-D-erythritol 4-phosphate cytidylyltransferase [Actinomycetota bacterium]